MLNLLREYARQCGFQLCVLSTLRRTDTDARLTSFFWQAKQRKAMRGGGGVPGSSDLEISARHSQRSKSLGPERGTCCLEDACVRLHGSFRSLWSQRDVRTGWEADETGGYAQLSADMPGLQIGSTESAGKKDIHGEWYGYKSAIQTSDQKVKSSGRSGLSPSSKALQEDAVVEDVNAESIRMPCLCRFQGNGETGREIHNMLIERLQFLCVGRLRGGSEAEEGSEQESPRGVLYNQPIGTGMDDVGTQCVRRLRGGSEVGQGVVHASQRSVQFETPTDTGLDDASTLLDCNVGTPVGFAGQTPFRPPVETPIAAGKTLHQGSAPQVTAEGLIPESDFEGVGQGLPEGIDENVLQDLEELCLGKVHAGGRGALQGVDEKGEEIEADKGQRDSVLVASEFDSSSSTGSVWSNTDIDGCDGEGKCAQEEHSHAQGTATLAH